MVGAIDSISWAAVDNLDSHHFCHRSAFGYIRRSNGSPRALLFRELILLYLADYLDHCSRVY